MSYRIFYGPNTVHWIESNATVQSGQPNQETFIDESKALARLLELNENFFPQWDREDFYQVGDRVKFGNCIFRSLQENGPREFKLPNKELEPNAEIPTPMNRQARWEMVCNPEFENEEESN